MKINYEIRPQPKLVYKEFERRDNVRCVQSHQNPWGKFFIDKGFEGHVSYITNMYMEDVQKDQQIIGIEGSPGSHCWETKYFEKI